MVIFYILVVLLNFKLLRKNLVEILEFLIIIFSSSIIGRHTITWLLMDSHLEDNVNLLRLFVLNDSMPQIIDDAWKQLFFLQRLDEHLVSLLVNPRDVSLLRLIIVLLDLIFLVDEVQSHHFHIKLMVAPLALNIILLSNNLVVLLILLLLVGQGKLDVEKVVLSA